MQAYDHPRPEVPWQAEEPATGVDLIGQAQVVWRAKWIILAAVLLATLASAVVSLYVLEVTFLSEASITPTEQAGSGSGLRDLVANLPMATESGLGAQAGAKSDLILAFLNSNSLVERLIRKHELLPVLYPDAWDQDTRSWRTDSPGKAPSVVKAIQTKALQRVFQAVTDKQYKVIRLSWESKDPVLAKRMLDHVLEELTNFLDHEYVSDARREREFVEAQLAEATSVLERWESQVPTPELPLATIQRELTAARSVYTEMRRQFALARINEAKELVRFKVLDEPFVPEIKHKPRRTVIVAATFVGSAFIGVAVVLLVEAIRSATRRGRRGQDGQGRS